MTVDHQVLPSPIAHGTLATMPHSMKLRFKSETEKFAKLVKDAKVVIE
jgi:hypothetical protein